MTKSKSIYIFESLIAVFFAMISVHIIQYSYVLLRIKIRFNNLVQI